MPAISALGSIGRRIINLRPSWAKCPKTRTKLLLHATRDPMGKWILFIRTIRSLIPNSTIFSSVSWVIFYPYQNPNTFLPMTFFMYLLESTFAIVSLLLKEQIIHPSSLKS
jgi:hypothetical protein